MGEMESGRGRQGILGPLMGGPECRLSILRNYNVTCRFFFNVPVDFKIVQCRLSNLRNAPCHITDNFSHVDSLHVACRF